MIFQLEMMIFQLKLGLWSQSNDRDGRNRVRFTSIFHRFSIDFSSIFHRCFIDFPSIFHRFSMDSHNMDPAWSIFLCIWCWFGVDLVLVWCSWSIFLWIFCWFGALGCQSTLVATTVTDGFSVSHSNAANVFGGFIMLLFLAENPWCLSIKSTLFSSNLHTKWFKGHFWEICAH